MNSTRVVHRLMAGLLLTATCAPMPVDAQDQTTAVLDPIGQEIRARLEEGTDVLVAGRPLRSPETLRAAYAERAYRPAWVGRSSPLATLGHTRRALADASAHGLAPTDYRTADIDRLTALTWFVRQPAVAWLADLELMLADGVALLAVHLESGRLEPGSLRPRGTADRTEGAADRLKTVMEAARPDLALAAMGPSGAEYRALKSSLRDLLHASRPVFAGAPLIKEMDEPSRIRVNLERWRWTGARPDDTHVLVNIADASLAVIEHDRTAFRLRAILGRPDRSTPEFSAAITSIVLSPYWHVPWSIQVRDKLPLIKRNPGYLAASRIVLFRRSDGGVVDPAEIDWASLSPDAFGARFRLRQEPGPRNAMGLIKFVFPNPHGVYVHDTDDHSLFDETRRYRSSGCVRIEDPFLLADHLLRDDPAWPPNRIRLVANQGIERRVDLAEPVPIHIMYLTARVDEHGFRRLPADVYGRDASLLEALDRPLPTR